MDLTSQNRSHLYPTAWRFPWRSLTSLLVVAALMLSVLVLPSSSSASGTELFFSEYIEGTSNNKALEIYNPTGAAINLAAGSYNVQMYFNGNTSAGLTINLSGTVPAGGVFVLAHSSANATILAVANQTNGAGWFNGDDAVVLRKGTAIIDSIGQIGFDPGTEWGSGLTSTADNTLRRKAGITAGRLDASALFNPADEWDGYATDTFDGLGSHSTSVVVNQPIATTCPAITTTQSLSGSGSMSATDPDGKVVSVSPVAALPTGITLGALTAAAADGDTATVTLSVSSTAAAGTYSIQLLFSNDDATPQTATCTASVTVSAVLPIGAVQGAVQAGDNGMTHRSPYAPATGNSAGSATVAVRGIITQKTLARTSSGASNYGLFLQNTPDQADGDPLTSDGIFVYMGTFTTLLRAEGGSYLPQVGDEIILSGRVSEYFSMTQLSSTLRVQAVVQTGLDVDTVIPVIEANPPDDLAEANRYWERLEGMRLHLPAGSLAISGRNVFSGTEDSEIWLLHPDHPIAQQADPYARRSFRDAHPLDNNPALVDDGNGYRILIGGLGVKATANDNTLLLPPARTYDVTQSSVAGGLYLSFSKYQIVVEEQPEFQVGFDPSLNGPPQAADLSREFTIASYNVENLYDFRDDPFDGCDFVGNSGCPGVNPPFNYVPGSNAEYQARLVLMAQQIIHDLHAPDIILIQEAEDQDICAVVAGALDCGATNNRDGKPDTLQELTLAILAAGGPAYDAAYDRDGADARGITSAFLYRTDRVELLTPAADDPVLGANPTVSYPAAGLAYNSDLSNPKSLNALQPAGMDTSTGLDGTNVFTRAPQVGLFRVWRDGVGSSLYSDMYVIANHFSSGPDRRVGQRREQAAYNAAIVAALQAANPNVKVLAGGDLNVYPRPDDPFDPPTDQLGPLYDLGLQNLYDALLADLPVAAYGYVFNGQAQTLDQLFVTPSLHALLVQMRTAHINADWPAAYDGFGARGLSDHDPSVARFGVEISVDRLMALLEHYHVAGSVRGNNTLKILREFLQRAKAYADGGQSAASAAQLQSFALAVEGFTPRFIDRTAADGLIKEARLLIEMAP